MLEKHSLDFIHVQHAAQRLAGQAVQTPILHSAAIDKKVGAKVFFKCENLQRMGAFKFRGAYNALAALTQEQRAYGVVAYSSGNHAQAVALAAKLFAVPATIVMPKDAPKIKIANVRALGAKVIHYDRLNESREGLASELAKEKKAVIIPPFAHPKVIAGQGTAALEFLTHLPDLDFLFVPLGGGGLLSGTLIAQKKLAPNCKVYGVEPKAGDDAQQSLASGRIVRIKAPNSIADGALTEALAPITFNLIRHYAQGVLTVTDAQLIKAMQIIATHLKLLIEPTAALGVAAVVNRLVPIEGKRVGVILSGGNVDLDDYAHYLTAEVQP